MVSVNKNMEAQNDLYVSANVSDVKLIASSGRKCVSAIHPLHHLHYLLGQDQECAITPSTCTPAKLTLYMCNTNSVLFVRGSPRVSVEALLIILAALLLAIDMDLALLRVI